MIKKEDKKKIVFFLIFSFLLIFPLFTKADPTIQLSPPTSTCSGSQAQVELSWKVTGHPTPNLFDVWRKEVGGTTSTITSTTATFYTDNTVESGKRYVYQIKGEKGANVWYSNEATSTAVYCPPTLSISTSTCETDGPHILLNWTPTSGDLLEYKIFREDFGELTTTSPTTISYDDGPNLKAREEYVYYLKAVWKDGNLATSATTSILAPACPPVLNLSSSCLTSKEPGGPVIKLTWNSLFEAEKYKIYRKTPKDADFEYLAETTSTSYSDYLVNSFSDDYWKGGKISYYLQAQWDNGAYAHSEEKEIDIPRCVPFLKAESYCQETAPYYPEMHLFWTGTLNALSYAIYSNGSSTYQGWVSDFSYNNGYFLYTHQGACDGELTCANTYQVKTVVTGVAGYLESNSVTKAVDCETIASPSPPPDLTSINTFCSSSYPAIEISWQASDNVVYYKLYRNNILIGNFKTTSLLDTGIEMEATYTYYVIAQGRGGTETTSTNALTIKSADCTPPSKPDIELISTACTDSAEPYIEISWSTTTNTFQYEIYRGTSLDNLSLLTTLSSSDKNWKDTGVSRSTTYYYQVVAKGPPGVEGTSSNIKTITTLSCLPTLPKLAFEGGCDSDGSTWIKLSWNTDHKYTHHYDIYREDKSTTTPIVTVSPPVTSWKDTSVSRSTSYKYKVVAVAVSGAKNTEGFKSVTSLSCLPTIPLLTLTTGCESYSPYVTLDWSSTDHANTTEYEIYRKIDDGIPQLIATTSPPTASYKDYPLLDETIYKYQVVAVGPVGTSSQDYKSIETYYCKPPGNFHLNTPFNVYCQGSYPRVDTSWTTSSKALYYELYRYDINKDSTTTIFNITSTSYTDIGFGKALKFDEDDYVKISGLDVDRTWGVTTTIEFWMFWTGKDNQMPFGWKEPYDLWFRSGCFGFNTGEGNVYGISSAGLANRWVHVVAMFYNGVPSDKHNALYINGVKQNIFSCLGSTSASRRVTSEAKISGWAYGSGYYFEGIIDEVRIYNRALSDTEVKEHYQGIYKDETGLIGLWHFDEGKGQYVSDSSNYGNDGILGGSESSQSSDPTWVESGVQCDTDYKWTAKAFNEGGSVPSSNSFSTTTPICPPTKPGLVLETSCDPTSTKPFVKAKWSYSIRAQNYEIYRDGVLVATTSQDTDPEKRVFIDSNLNETKTYNYYVKAIGIAGNATSDVISITTPCCSPEKPKNFKAQFECSGSYPRVKLTWDDSNCTEYYKIYKEDGVNITDLGAISDTDSGSYTFFDTNVKVNTAYTYWIKAIASGGIESPASSSSIPEGNYCPLSTPSIISLTTNCTSSSPINEISWQDDTPFNTFEYRIYRNTINSIPSTPTKKIASSTPEFSSRKWIDKDPSLSDETTYYYWVESVGPAGSATSSPLSITTLYCGSPPTPDLSFEKAFCKENCPYLTLNWTTSNKATSYNLYRVNPDNSTSTYSTRLPPFTDRGQYALEFDGVDDYVKVLYIPEYNLQSLTIELWMKTNAYPSYAGSSYGDYLISIACGRYLWIGTYASGKNHIQFGLDFENAGWKSIRTYDIPQDKWIQVVATYDGEEMKLFIDGEERASKTIADSIWTGSSYHLKIAEGYKGLMDEVRIYNRALSESEIKEHYQGIYRNETGLVGMWHFDEGEGTTVYDSSGMGNKGKIAGVKWVEGKSGSALDFSGEEGYVDCGDSSSLDIQEAITISTWIYPRDTDGHIVNRGGGWSDNGYSLYHYGGKIRIELQNKDTSEKTICDNLAPPYNEWHHVAFTWSKDSKKIKTYIDGSKALNECTFLGPIGIPSQNLNIGRNENHGYYFNGLIDEVRIYSRALSEGEISDLFNGEEIETGLVALWHFDEATGTVVYDSSPLENNGTIKNKGAKWVLSSDAPYYIRPLGRNQTYKYFVKAVGVNLESTSSNEISTTTPSCLPAKPDLKVTPKCDYSIDPPKPYIELNWQEDENTSYWSIYRKREDEASFTFLANTTQNFYEDKNIESEKSYEYFVTAYPESSESDLFSTTSDSISTTSITCYPLPYGGNEFSVTTTPTCYGYQSAIKIKWDADPLDNTIYYNIWSKKAGELEFSTTVTNLASNITQYLHLVEPTTTYVYKVEAVGTGPGNSIFSTTTATTSLDCESLPPFPPIIYATSTEEVLPSENEYMMSASIYWISSGNAEWYYIYRDGGLGFTQIATTSSSTEFVMSFTDYTVEDGKSYDYKIIAENKNGTSTSNIVSIYVPVARPGPFALLGTWLEENLIHLEWEGASTTPSGGAITYELQRSSTSTFASYTVLKVLSCSSTTPSCKKEKRQYDDAVPTWHRIYYRVKATNSYWGDTKPRYSNPWDTGPRTPKWKEIPPQ